MAKRCIFMVEGLWMGERRWLYVAMALGKCLGLWAMCLFDTVWACMSVSDCGNEICSIEGVYV
jgi:hypothetical protein